MSRKVERTASVSQSLSASITSTPVPVPRPWDLVLAAFYVRATTEMTGLSLGAGTFTRLARQVGATTYLELWAGYGFAANETDTTLNYSAPGAAGQLHIGYFANGAVHTVPTVDVVGATGTGTAVDPGPRTPTLADETQLAYVLGGHAHANLPTAYAHAPGGNEAFALGSQSAGTASLWTQRRAPTSLSAHNVTATIASAEWVAINALITPTPATPSTDTPHVYKGRDRQSLDTIGAA